MTAARPSAGRPAAGSEEGTRRSSAARPRHRGVILAVTCMVALMTVLDVSVMTVALPSAGADLGMSDSALQWIINGYTLTFAGFLLLGGRAADLLGRKQVFVFGLALFTAASLAGGLAQTGWQLVAARAVQGIGGAVLAPVALSVLTTTFPEPGEKARALAVWSATAGLGGALGGVVGGVLTGLLSWRWVLIVNVPLGVALIGFSLWALTAGPRLPVRGQLDLPGSLAVTLGTAALVAGIIAAEQEGWTSPQALALTGAGLVLLVAFVLIERRVRAPLVPLSVFRVRPLAVADAISLMTGGVLPATFYFLSLYLQQVRGADPLATGVALLVPALGVSVGAQLAPRLMARAGYRAVYLGGAALAVVGLAWLSRLTPDGGYAVQILVPSFLTMTGLGLSGLPLTIAATSGVGPDRAGLASGLLNASRQIGGAVLLAVLVAVAGAVTASAQQGGGAALTHGYGAALLVAAVLVGAAALLGLALPRRAPASPVPSHAARPDVRPGNPSCT